MSHNLNSFLDFYPLQMKAARASLEFVIFCFVSRTIPFFSGNIILTLNKGMNQRAVGVYAFKRFPWW